MVSPYFIPGDRGVELMKDGVAHGVRMVVLTNSLDATDESLVYAGYARYRLQLLKAGVGLYELGARLATRDKQLGDFRSSSGRLHAKVAIVDRRRMFVGSMNLDGRSARLNTEIGLMVDSPELAALSSRSWCRCAFARCLRTAAGPRRRGRAMDRVRVRRQPPAARRRTRRQLARRPEGLAPAEAAAEDLL